MPEVPPVPGPGRLSTVSTRAESLGDRVADVFSPGGALARALPGYEPRPGQVDMARAVARTLERGGMLLAEAGTGTGKTLAYLVPAILSRQRVLVSTGTKNLQEQIYFKDLPALRAALGVDFAATCMKGRTNYLCLHRLDQMSAQEDARAFDVFLPIVREWAARTQTGDRAELEDLPEDLAFWNEVSATADTCLGSECPRYDECFVTLMRQRAAASDVVIVNHHLFCADAAVRRGAFGEVIPACHQVVVDEAHQLEDVATQYFGLSISTYRLEDLARDIERAAFALREASPDAQTELIEVADRLRTRSRDFFHDLALAHGRTPQPQGRGEERVRVTRSSLETTADSAAALTGALDLAEAALSLSVAPRDRGGQDGAPDSAVDLLGLARRAAEARDELRCVLRAGDPGFVYFVELRGRGVFLRAAPIDVSAIVRDVLFERARALVLTSATLTVDGSFEYVKARLGLEPAEELHVQSEFDYARQALLYLPPRMPDPRSPGFAVAAAHEIVELLRRTRGRAFVLFTSYATLRSVQAMAEMALDYPILVQGTAPRTQLLRRFRETPHAVLLATSSFWQGVDVVGEALSCVIIDKLPFASPADPVTAARIEAIRARGGEPFDQYQVPLAILTLQQGLGRLIRHRTDRGILAVLDPRLRTKGYGRRFLTSLPNAPVVHDLGAVEAFMSIV